MKLMKYKRIVVTKRGPPEVFAFRPESRSPSTTSRPMRDLPQGSLGSQYVLGLRAKGLSHRKRAR